MAKLKGKARAKARKQQRLNTYKKHEGYKKKILDMVLKWDNPILYEVCAEVGKEEDIQELMQNMGRVLHFSKNGVGLAAPQIGVTKKVILVLLDREKPTFFINPEIKIHDGNIIKSRESCLSYPGIEAVIDRNDKITIDYEDEKRVHHVKDFTGFNAIVLQHEIDHTNGVCGVGEEWKRLNTPAPENNDEVEEEVYEEDVEVESNSSEK